MKNSKVYSLWIGIVLLGLHSCEIIDGFGPVITEIRQKSGYEGLRVTICGQVNFTIAPEFKVEVKAQENILDELETSIERDALVLRWSKPWRIHDCDEVTVNISGPDLKFIQSSGSADIDVFGKIAHNDLELSISGSGSIDIDEAIIRDDLSAHVSGSGDMYIHKGSAKFSELKLSGSGEIDLSNLITDANTSHVSGSGKIVINVIKSLEAFISGSGDIYYYGNPHIDSKISGSGKVRAL